MSVGYRLVGILPWVPFAINNLAAAATVMIAFLFTIVLFDDSRAAAWAALMMALVPMQLLWFNTAAVEPTASLGCAAAMLSAATFARSRTTAALGWMVCVTVFAASLRPECVLVVPLVVGIVLVFARDELLSARIWWAAAAASVLGWIVIVHILAVRNESWGAAGGRLSLDYVEHNLRTNGWFYVSDERFPVVCTLLACIALLIEWRKRATWVVAAYFALFWAVYLLFYTGSYDYGADVRYSLVTYPPLIILAGRGAAVGVEWLQQRTPSHNVAAGAATRANAALADLPATSASNR